MGGVDKMKKLKQIIFVLGLVLIMGGNASGKTKLEILKSGGTLAEYISECFYFEIFTILSEEALAADHKIHNGFIILRDEGEDPNEEVLNNLSKKGNGQASYLSGLMGVMFADFDKAMKYFKLSKEQNFLTGYDEIIPCLESIISDHTSPTRITKTGKIAKVELEKIKKISEKERQEKAAALAKKMCPQCEGISIDLSGYRDHRPALKQAVHQIEKKIEKKRIADAKRKEEQQFKQAMKGNKSERQKEFLQIVKIHAEKYKNAKNQIKKSLYRKKRMKAFSEFFSKDLCFKSWVGTVKSLDTDKNGDAMLKIDIGGFKYQNYGSKAIPMSDTLFDTVAEMEENDKVVLSGCFSKHIDAFADNWYLFTHEHTENGAMTSPTFQGEYLDIKKIN